MVIYSLCIDGVVEAQQLQVERAAEDNIPLNEFAAFFKLGFKLVVTDGFRCTCNLSHQLFESAERANCGAFKGTTELLDFPKRDSFTPRKDCLHPE